jgi:hypothetical protein
LNKERQNFKSSFQIQLQKIPGEKKSRSLCDWLASDSSEFIRLIVKLFLSKMESSLKSFFPVAWLGHLGLGLSMGIMGPVQPYLAR